MRRWLLSSLPTAFLCVALAQHAPFTDVAPDHWAAEAVMELAELGIFEGFPDGTFRGDEALTRYEAALLFARLLQGLGWEEAEVAALVGSWLVELEAIEEGAGPP